MAVSVLVVWLCACANPEPLVPPAVDPVVSCAWFGDREGDLLFFGVSKFWNAARHSGSARAALREREPARIGRFDLAREHLLPPIELEEGPRYGGVWDVLALGDGRLAYTALAEHAGWVEPATGRSGLFVGAGAGANELAALPDGRVALTQYFEGSVLIFGPGGALRERFVLPVEPGIRVAPKSIAYDPSRGKAGWLWLTTDLFGDDDNAIGHDTRALDITTGAARLQIASPELQNVAFRGDGTGYLVWADGNQLSLQILDPGVPADIRSGRWQLLSDRFRHASDFAQDIRVEATGEVLITLWSGRVFVVGRDERIQRVSLPRDPPGSLFYSAALSGTRVCATRCADVAVVCGDLATGR